MKKTQVTPLIARLKEVRASLKTFNSEAGTKIGIGCYSQREDLTTPPDSKRETPRATANCWVAIDLVGDPEEIFTLEKFLNSQWDKPERLFTHEVYQRNPFEREPSKITELRFSFDLIKEGLFV